MRSRIPDQTAQDSVFARITALFLQISVQDRADIREGTDIWSRIFPPARIISHGYSFISQDTHDGTENYSRHWYPHGCWTGSSTQGLPAGHVVCVRPPRELSFTARAKPRDYHTVIFRELHPDSSLWPSDHLIPAPLNLSSRLKHESSVVLLSWLRLVIQIRIII